MDIGLTSGTFDLFHHSHLHYLERCKKYCDKLIVGVDSDILVRATKGHHRPIFKESHRLALLNSLGCVDIAFILNKVGDLTKIAADFKVTQVFKCEKWEGLSPIYGTENADLLIVPDEPNMVSTTEIIDAIRKSGRL